MLSRSVRALHTTARRAAVTPFQMPAMSPTMSEGNIASWKKREGEAFSAGDVLLEIETDKATIDVEAQEDGIMGKIIAPDGSKNIPVGNLIALLAEEGDDISNLEIPKQATSTAPPTPSPTPTSSSPSPPAPAPSTPHISHGPPPEHSRPLFPSVHRLLLEHGITNVDQIKGTGVRGMLTKGDVLTFLGKASGPLGTFKFGPSPIQEALAANGKAGGGAPKPEPPKVLDGPAIRRLIVGNFLQASKKKSNPAPSFASADFDSVLADYLPKTKPSSSSSPVPSATAKATPPPPSLSNSLDGLH